MKNFKILRIFFDSALARNSAVLFLGAMLANVFNYVFHLVIGREVSVEIYGEAESLLSLIAIISVPATTLSVVATKYAAACKADGNYSGSREIWIYLNKKILKFGLPIFLLAVLATPYIGKFLNMQNNFVLVLLWMSMLLSFFAAVNSGILSGWQKFKEVSFSGIWGAAVKLIFGIILVKIGFALGGIISSFVLGGLAAYLATILALKFIVAKKNSQTAADCAPAINFQALKRYVLPVFIGNLAFNVLGNVDVVLAKHNLSALVAGQYSALTIVSKIIFFATGIIAMVLFSMSAENSHKGNSSRRILNLALLFVLTASTVATLIYFAYPGFILSILFGNKYQEVAPYLGWFAISVTLFSLSNVIFQYLLSIHKTSIVYALFAIAAVLIGMIFFFGTSIYAILALVIGAQTLAIIAGVYFINQERKRENENALNYNTGL